MRELSRKRFYRQCALIISLILFVISDSFAEIVELEVSPGIMATAEFEVGEADSPVVLILHGFLQSRGFPTVEGLGGALVDSDMTVLRPTLSLGINRRSKSLPCEAIHTHSMEMDTREVGVWVRWLHQRTGKKVVLIGHSAGSVQLLSYLSSDKAAPVKSSILVSLSYFGPGRAANESEEQAALARERLTRGEKEPAEYGMAFCKSYVSPPAQYLSYYGWNQGRTLEAVQSLDSRVAVIIGEEDQRIDRDWIEILRGQGVKVISVRGANHFFDQQHEFDLLEIVEEMLSRSEG